jgi:hypothetical protein
MKVKVKTIKGWVNKSDYLTSQNSNNNIFVANLNNYLSENKIVDKGFKKLNAAFDTLNGKGATEKIIINGYYWRGNWSDATKETVCVYYK